MIIHSILLNYSYKQTNPSTQPHVSSNPQQISELLSYPELQALLYPSVLTSSSFWPLKFNRTQVPPLLSLEWELAVTNNHVTGSQHQTCSLFKPSLFLNRVYFVVSVERPAIERSKFVSLESSGRVSEASAQPCRRPKLKVTPQASGSRTSYSPFLY